MDSSLYKKAKFLAIGFHSLLFLCLIIISVYKNKPQEKPHVFSIVSDAPAVAAAPKPKAAPAKPKPAPAPEPKKLSYDDFVKKRGTPKPTQKKAHKPSPQTVKAPKLDFSDITKSLTKVEISSNNTAQPPNALSHLKSLIDTHWLPPQTKQLSAYVEFSIQPNSRILLIRFIEPSGSSDFDTSIHDVFNEIDGNPNLQLAQGTYQMRFTVKPS